MDILKSGDVPALVTNIEVLHILTELIDERTKADDAETQLTGRKKVEVKQLRHRDFIEHSVYDYLQGCSSRANGSATIEKMPELVKKLKARAPPPPPTKSSSNSSNTGGNDFVKMEEGENDTLITGGTSGVIDMVDNDDNEAVEFPDRGDGEENGGYGLTDAETLQILNHLPITEPVEIHLMIEDLSSRLDEDKQTELLQL
eukprot:CAMPEP_0198264812 /NCGR_PEP_ID=MMETSP1447-20131203/17861_1 /TAXON_ID=420782 /ORGANISM="Chaetoceros dichaeta, Strain CCMP1751" /LENGTH=200 /DNA_ID=CAMNT_0043953917 /DNA_START=66 /DNA_END=665 /DNA_ORIENTATION=+